VGRRGCWAGRSGRPAEKNRAERVARPGWAENRRGYGRVFGVFLTLFFLLTPSPNFKFFTHFFPNSFQMFQTNFKTFKTSHT
jgi:hypothetical protein